MPQFTKIFWSDHKSHLKGKVSIASFDFLGCGKADGKYITLGCSESKQIKAVVDYF